MIINEIDNITEQYTPPTPESIDRERQKQIDAIKGIRRRLMNLYFGDAPIRKAS